MNDFFKMLIVDDHTRVVLESHGRSDYINANYVDVSTVGHLEGKFKVSFTFIESMKLFGILLFIRLIKFVL